MSLNQEISVPELTAGQGCFGKNAMVVEFGTKDLQTLPTVTATAKNIRREFNFRPLNFS